MAILLGINISVLRAQRALDRNAQALSKDLQQLASGTRIVAPSDDPAGLAIADKLKNDRRMASAALRNASDALSVVELGNDALDAISTVLTRMAELASQGADSSVALSQRSAMQTEFTALASEVDRIATTTQINGMTILSMTGSLNFQVGITSQDSSSITLSTSVAAATLKDLGLAQTSAVTYSLSGTSDTYRIAASRTALDAVRAAIDLVSIKRGHVGAAETRLQTAITAVSSFRDIVGDAESKVRDLDVAVKISEVIRLSILNQVGTQMIAQANQTSGTLLQLFETSLDAKKKNK